MGRRYEDGGTRMYLDGQPAVDCAGGCGRLTKSLGTKLCDSCWQKRRGEFEQAAGRHVSGVDLDLLKAAIRKDLELIGVEANRLEDLARKAKAIAATAELRLAKGESLGSLPCVCSSDLDMQASRVARRVDHLQALTEVAFLAEGGSL